MYFSSVELILLFLILNVLQFCLKLSGEYLDLCVDYLVECVSMSMSIDLLLIEVEKKKLFCLQHVLSHHDLTSGRVLCNFSSLKLDDKVGKNSANKMSDFSQLTPQF